MKKPKPRLELIRALAYCVEVLCSQSLMEGSGAIRAALKSDDRIWDYFDDTTRYTLGCGLGYFRPDDSGAKRETQEQPTP